MFQQTIFMGFSRQAVQHSFDHGAGPRIHRFRAAQEPGDWRLAPDHDELAVWIDDAYIVSFLVRTVSVAVLEFVVEMLDPSHPGLPSRQATWEDHPAPSSPTSLHIRSRGISAWICSEAAHRSDRSHSPGCHHARTAATGFSTLGAAKRDAHRPLRRLVRHHARPHLRDLRGQPRPLRPR